MCTPKLIALDLSLVATGYYDGELSEVWKTKVFGHDRLDYILQQLENHLFMVSPDAVFIEGFSFGSKGRAIYEIGGLGYLVRHRLWTAGIPYCEVSPSTLKKYATGSGVADKDEMLASAIRNFAFTGSNNNAADAWLLWYFGFDEIQHIEPNPKVHWVGERPTWKPN